MKIQSLFSKWTAVGLILLVASIVGADSVYRNTIMGTGARRDSVEFNWVEPSAGSAMNMVPGTTNTNALGTSSLRWSDVQTTDLTVADDLVLTDDMTIGGDLAITGTLTAPRANVSVQLSTAPRTSVTLVFNSTGTLVFNTTHNYLCVSTGSAQSSFVIVSTISANVACAS